MPIKKPISIVALALVFAVAVPGQAPVPAPLTTLAAIKNISNAEAQRHNPVLFQGTVTYVRSYERVLFVQDGDAAIYVDAITGLNLVPGDRVLVRGEMRSSFHLYVLSSDTTRHGA
jgi:hypothetical protein